MNTKLKDYCFRSWYLNLNLDPYTVGPNKHTVIQIKDAVHDGLRAVKNAIEDGSVVPGAGAFEVAAHAALTSAEFLNSVQGRAKYGVKVRVCVCAHVCVTCAVL